MISYEAQTTSQNLNSFSQGAAVSFAKTRGKNMTKEQEKEVVVDATTGLGGDYVSFPQDKRVKLAITNWRTVMTQKTFNDKTEDKAEFRADAIEIDDQEVHSLVAMASVRFRKGVNAILEDKDPSSTVVISVKKLGDGTNTTYDVELVGVKPAATEVQV